MQNYFVCTYGNFDRSSEFLKESIVANVYRLHRCARYPSALDLIRTGDIILLQNYCYIVAWGIAGSPMTTDTANEWRYVVHVEKWHSLDECNVESGIHSYGIRWATEVGGSMAVVKKVAADWAQSKLKSFESFKYLSGNAMDCADVSPYAPCLTSNEEVSCCEMTLKQLVEKTLKIPSYQRGYCWRRENIIELLDEVSNWMNNSENDSNEKLEKAYHLGTVIIKDGNIIDGQQRLLSLSILIYRLNGQEISLLNSEVAGTENASTENIGYLLRAQKTIAAWIKEKTDDTQEKKTSLANKLQECITFSVVNIPASESEDLAYRFFNTTNTAGKKLSDYDLLKNHHLRYVPNNCAHFAAARWNKLSKEEHTQRELLHFTLFRLRHWNRGKWFSIQADSTERRNLFRHFAVDIQPLPNIYNIPKTLQIDSILPGGMEFFSYVESYRHHWELFSQLECVHLLSHHLCQHSNGVLHSAIKAMLFMYYCKFGEQYIKEALYCIAYKVSELRNKDQVRREYLSKVSELRNNHQVRREYLSSENIIFETVQYLDRTTSAGEFFAWALDARTRYTPDFNGNTKAWYWESLRQLLAKLEKTNSFAVSKSIVNDFSIRGKK